MKSQEGKTKDQSWGTKIVLNGLLRTQNEHSVMMFKSMRVLTYSLIHIFTYLHIHIFTYSHIHIFNTSDSKGLCSATKRTSLFVESHFPLIQSPISRIRLMWVWHDSQQLTTTHCNARQHSPTQCNTLHGLGLSRDMLLRDTDSMHVSYSHIQKFAFSHLHIFNKANHIHTQDGEESWDALSIEVIFRKRALRLVALLRKEMCNLRHPMHLRHPVFTYWLHLICGDVCVEMRSDVTHGSLYRTLQHNATRNKISLFCLETKSVWKRNMIVTHGSLYCTLQHTATRCDVAHSSLYRVELGLCLRKSPELRLCHCTAEQTWYVCAHVHVHTYPRRGSLYRVKLGLRFNNSLIVIRLVCQKHLICVHIHTYPKHSFF